MTAAAEQGKRPDGPAPPARSVAVLSSGGLPRWLGWFGLLAAAAQPVGAASFQRSGWLMPQGDTVALQAEVGTLLLWLLATSILMLLGRPTARRQAARAGRHRPQVTNSKVGKPKGSGSNGPIGCSQPRLQRAL